MRSSLILWSAFTLLLVIMLGMNLKSHHVSFKEALTWSIVWVGLALETHSS